MPLSAKPAVRSGDGCKTQRRVPDGSVDAAAAAVGVAGAACLVEGRADDSEEDLRAVLLDSLLDEATLAARGSARNENDVNH